MEISVKYLPVVFILLVIILIIITLYDLLGGAKHLDDYSSPNNDTSDRKLQNLVLSLDKCLLRQVLNLLWITVSFLVYIKHRQVNDILNRYDMHQKKALNRNALRAGLVSAFGCSIMANFLQTEMLYIYWIGGILLFGCGAVYQCIQTIQYWNLNNVIGQKKTTILRMMLSAVSVISFTTCFICTVIAYARKKNDYSLPWGNEDVGIEFYKTSITLKWICATSTLFYLLSFIEEFRKITLYEPDVFVEDKVTSSVDTQYTNTAFEGK